MDKKENAGGSSRHRALENNGTTANDVQKAHAEADKDIAQDPDLSIHSPNDDLDEGETARLGEE